MFKKLTFDELATFYGTLSALEKGYGKEKVDEALGYMLISLDGKGVHVRQIELLPFEDDSIHFEEEVIKKDRTRSFYGRNPNGENDLIIVNFFKKNQLDPVNGILKMYHNDKKTQLEIGDIIGVGQRAVSRFLSEIPKSRKRKLLLSWGFDESQVERAIEGRKRRDDK